MISSLEFVSADVGHNTICDVKDCGRNALWFPVVKVWATGCSKLRSKPMEVEIGMAFCEAHKTSFTLADIPTLEYMVGEVASAHKRPTPDMSTAEIELRPLIHG